MRTQFTEGIIIIEKCNCGHDMCNRYQLSNGTFYRGTGFSLADATLYANAAQMYKILTGIKEAIKQDKIDEIEIEAIEYILKKAIS